MCEAVSYYIHRSFSGAFSMVIRVSKPVCKSAKSTWKHVLNCTELG